MLLEFKGKKTVYELVAQSRVIPIETRSLRLSKQQEGDKD